MTPHSPLRDALLARRRELIARLAAGADATGVADGGLVSLLAETHAALEALRDDEAGEG